MKLKVTKLLIFLMFIQGSFGCAHYFTSASSEQFFDNYNRPFAICIVEGEVFIGKNNSLRFKSEIRKDVRQKIRERVHQKYPSLVNDCEAQDKYLVVFKESQEPVKGDYLILSLGIIPLVAKTSYEVEIFYNEKSVYKANDEGKAIMSIFFVPFFILHRSESDILFDLLNGFLKKNIEAKTLQKMQRPVD